MNLRCKICDKEYSEVPADAVRLTSARGGRGHSVIYRFSDGSVHALVKIRNEGRESPEEN
jgi:hypothetical protein